MARNRPGGRRNDSQKRPPEPSPEPDALYDPLEPLPDSFSNIYRTARWLVRTAAAALALFFGWLQLNGLEFVPIATSLSAAVALKISSAVYYACWVAGLISDTDIQEGLYAIDPNKGRMPLVGFGMAVAFTVVFAVLCWTDTYSKFAAFLAVFFGINVIGWRYLVGHFLTQPVAESREAFRKHPLRREKLELVYGRYLTGKWQWARFAGGGLLIIVINLLAFTRVADLVLPVTGGLSRDMLIALPVMVFVAFMEAWIWIVRLRLRAALKMLEHLGKRYRFSPVGTS